MAPVRRASSVLHACVRAGPKHTHPIEYLKTRNDREGMREHAQHHTSEPAVYKCCQ